MCVAVRVRSQKEVKKITGVTSTVRHSGGTINNLSQIVRESKCMGCLTVDISCARVHKPFGIMHIEVTKKTATSSEDTDSASH